MTGSLSSETGPRDHLGAATEVRLSLALAAPRVGIAELERFLASPAAAELGPQDELSIAASPAPSVHADDLAQWMDERADAPGLSLSLHPSETTPMRLWGFAMSRARGRHVAALDLRDTLDRGWIEACVEACDRSPDAVLCGPVDPGDFENHCSWAAYLSEYGRFGSPLSDEPGELPGNNIVFPRNALPSAEALESEGFWKTFHLDAMRRRRADAIPVAVAPAMRVRVARRHSLREYLRRRSLHGRCYGGRRLQQPGAPPRLLCLAFTPLLPLVRTARVLIALPARRTWPLAALAPLVLGEIAWSWGEFAGYARGPGSACEELW